MKKKDYSDLTCLNMLVEGLVADSNPDNVSITRNEEGRISTVVYYREKDGESLPYETYTLSYDVLGNLSTIDITYSEVV